MLLGHRLRVASTALDYLIVAGITINSLFFLGRPRLTRILPIQYPLRYPTEILVLPPPPPPLEYTADELETAIAYLNLPTWSRGYIHCSDQQSEVTCSQVVRAYRTIRAWETNISSTPNESKKYFIIDHPQKGMGNKMMTDICGFTLALMSNRSVLVRSNYPVNNHVVNEHAYVYPPSVYMNESQMPSDALPLLNSYSSVPTNPDWDCFGAKEFVISEARVVGINDLLYAPMVYINADTADYCREHFGIHAAYFIGNYFSRFLPESLKEARAILETIPKSKRIIGMHVRYHRAGQYYSHGLNLTMPVVFEEADRRIGDSDALIALATDNAELKQMMEKRYPGRLVTSNAMRRPDKDHFSAMIDMALVLGSNEIVATYRSTFSYIIVSKLGRTAWWIEKEAPHCFPAGNSQSVGVSMIYHHRDTCNWRTNDRVKLCSEAHRHVIEDFFDYLAL